MSGAPPRKRRRKAAGSTPDAPRAPKRRRSKPVDERRSKPVDERRSKPVDEHPSKDGAHGGSTDADWVELDPDLGGSNRAKGRPSRSGGGGRRGGGGPPHETWIILRVLAVLGLIVAVLYALLVLGYGHLPGPGNGREVELEWPSGLSPETAAARLAAAGIVGSPTLFAWYLRATRQNTDLRPGHHLLTDDLSPSAIAGRMQRALSRGHAKVILREGLTRFDVAKRLQTARICGARAFGSAATDRTFLSEIGITADSAEGYLLPATYEFPLDSEPRDVLTRLKSEFDKRMERILRDHEGGVRALRDTLQWDSHQILTLASMIEKEAMADEERPVIASVFLNRLRDPGWARRRLLQSDPTSGYGCLVNPELYSCRNYTGRILPEMNTDEGNAYSTYRHEGLTPGPICNPSEKTLTAVVAPADTRYFFFVARGEGHHIFSETYAQHKEAIRNLRDGGAGATRPATSSPAP